MKGWLRYALMFALCALASVYWHWALDSDDLALICTVGTGFLIGVCTALLEN